MLRPRTGRAAQARPSLLTLGRELGPDQLRAEPGQAEVPTPSPSPAAAVWHTLWPVVTLTTLLALEAVRWLLRNIWKHT